GTEGQAFKPINKWFKEAGKSAGCVTTTRITHATPASFAISVTERWLEDKIAEKYLEEAYDVMLGGGIEHFLADKREDGRDMVAEFKNKGYHFVQTKEEMMGLPMDDKPIMGAFTESHLPYTLDHINDEELLTKVPTLAELTDTAIQKLSKNKNGFILQVEGGRVDHAAHSNDIGGLIYDQVALDDAIKVAVDFAEKDKETLVIITTDHGNASPSLTGSGRSYSESTEDFKKFHNFKRSNTVLMEKLKENNSSSYIKELISDATGIELDAKEIEIIQKATYESFYQDVVRNQRSLIVALSDVIGKHLAVTWANTHHTSDFTELAAMGPGSERLGGFVRNTELFQLMTSAAGVETNVPSFAEATG
ncbi:MAG: alkaline phosphatase, partial [Chitinophagaceae bacterium]